MISVLMAVKTSWEYIPHAIGSLMAQSYTDWELIIGVNGLGSNSHAHTAACSFGMFTENQLVMDMPDVPNKGAALNAMIANANGDYIAILDVDDVWHPLKLERQLPLLQMGYDVVGTRGEYFGTVKDDIGVPSGQVGLDYLLKQNGILNSSAVIRRELAHWEPMDEPIEDYDLWLRLASEGRKLWNVNETLTFIRCHPGQWSHGKWNVAALRDKYARQRR